MSSDQRQNPQPMTRQQAHRHLVGQMRGSGKLARKAQRRIAVAMVKQAIVQQKARGQG